MCSARLGKREKRVSSSYTREKEGENQGKRRSKAWRRKTKGEEGVWRPRRSHGLGVFLDIEVSSVFPRLEPCF